MLNFFKNPNFLGNEFENDLEIGKKEININNNSIDKYNNGKKKFIESSRPSNRGRGFYTCIYIPSPGGGYKYKVNGH